MMLAIQSGTSLLSSAFCFFFLGMKMRRINVLGAKVLLLVCILMGIHQNTFASSLVQNTAVSWGTGRGAFAVHFKHPVNVLSMTPRSEGQILTFELQVLGLMDDDPMFQPQWLGTQHQNYDKLYEYIRLEKTGKDRAKLEIKFQRYTQFRVQRTRDSKKIVVSTDILANEGSNQIAADVPSSSNTVLANPVANTVASDPVSVAATKTLMDQAKKAMVSLNYASAAKKYRQVAEQGNSEYAIQALEFLGVALEKQGKNQEAQNVYSQYLGAYPNSDGAARVQQRLAGVRSLNATPNKKRREVADASDNDSKLKFFGTVSEYYRFSSVAIDDEDESDVRESAFYTDADLNMVYRMGNLDIKGRINGGVISDVSGDSDSDSLDVVGFENTAVEEKDTRLGHFFVEVDSRLNDWFVRAGRQHSARHGILGTFDGVNGSYGITDWLKVNGVWGYQADSPYDTTIETDYNFFGASVDIVPADWGLAMSAYFITQVFNEIDDRQAIGGDIRLKRGNFSIFTLLDYDLLFEEVNALTFISSWVAPTKTRLSFSFDQRKSPVLAMRNATYGQDENLTVYDLINGGLDEDDIKELALANTSENSVINFTVSQPFFERFLWNSDITITSFTPADNIVEDDPLGNTGDQFSIGTQLVVNRMLSQNDVNTFGIRFIDQENTQIIRTSYDGKFFFRSVRGLNIRPGLDFDVRTDGIAEDDQEEISQLIFVPNIRADYTFLRRHHLEIELGMEIITRDYEDEDETQGENGFFGAIGYWLDI